MPSFLQNILPFYGTGERNADGESLEEFLDKYDPRRYETPSCTTDAVIFSTAGQLNKELEGLKLLLVKRSNHPSIGYWALPGGFVNMRENLDAAAGRELLEETGVDGLLLEQIGTYGDYDRDPRTRVITTAYMALVREGEKKVTAGDDAADAVWCDVELKKQQTCSGPEEKIIYKLHICNQEKNLDTEALVEYTGRGTLIRQERYHVIEPGMTAVDHAAVITQAMVLLQSRIK